MGQGAQQAVGTYLYCIARAKAFGPGSPSFQSPGLGGPDAPVRTIEYADLAAVVSDAPVIAYDITRDNLVAHQRVVEEAMSRSDVLPVAFGTVARDDQDVREHLLTREYDELDRHLEYVRGRVALALKVLWDRGHLYLEIVAERDDIRGLRDLIAGRPPETVYVERIQLGELTAAAIADKRDRDADAILDALSPFAVDVRLNGLMTDMMILNAAFLVDADQVEAFDAQVQRLGEIHGERLVFQYTGPLPPYSFVNVRVNWEDEAGGPASQLLEPSC